MSCQLPIDVQRTHMDGVAYRRLKGTQVVLPLILGSRRGDPSAVIRQFVGFVKRAVKDHS